VTAALRRRRSTFSTRQRLRWRGPGWVLAGLLAAIALTGCGNDPAPREAVKTTTVPREATKAAAKEPKLDPGEPASNEDRQEIVAVLKTMEGAVNAGDAPRLCNEVYAFEGDTTAQACVKVLGPALKQSKPQVSITVGSVKTKGSRATVTATSRGVDGSGGPSRRTYTLVKDDGRWRVLFD